MLFHLLSGLGYILHTILDRHETAFLQTVRPFYGVASFGEKGKQNECRVVFDETITIHTHTYVYIHTPIVTHTIDHNSLFRQILQKWHTLIRLCSLHLSSAFVQLAFTSPQKDCFSPFLSPRGTGWTCLFNRCFHVKSALSPFEHASNNSEGRLQCVFCSLPAMWMAHANGMKQRS